MIFESKVSCATAQNSFDPVTRPRLQRKCSCGGTPGPSGECAACEQKRRAGTNRGQPVQTKLAVNAPGDKYEREADRMADAVMAGKEENVERRTSNVERRIQREEKTPPPKDNYEEARKKALDALQETPIAKQLKAKAEEMGAEFLSSVEGKVVAGTALGGALAGIIASNSEFPVGIPELPLDFIAPGLKAKITWEGPSQNPTAAGLVLTSASGVSVGGSYTSTPASPGKPAEQKAGLSLTIPLGGSSKKKGPSEKERFRAETARLAAEQAKIREGQKSAGERAEDKAFLNDYVRSKLNDPLNPLALPGLGRPLVPGPERKKEEEPLLRKASSESASIGTAPPIVDEVLQSPGQPLDPATRRFMEGRFDHDFGNVRVHRDDRAEASARAVNAHAYTVGAHLVFDAGRYSPATSAGQRLLAHELAHVVQQDGAATMVQRETYYGGGYKQRAFGSVDAEIAAGQKKPSEWHPATQDMAATAAGSGGGEAVSTLDELLTKLEGKGKGSVKRLNLIGHSNSRVFSFGGTITKDTVEFSPDAALYRDALTTSAKRIAALRDRFGEGAKIVLYSCDAGTGQALLDAVGEAFGICVEGFTSEIWWCLMKKDGKAVRGHIWAQNPNDPLAPEHPPDCETLGTNVTTLTPGGKSTQCGGKKPAP